MEVILSKKLFSIPILNTMSHNEETIKVLRPHVRQREQTKFIRNAILDFAFSKGFMHGMNTILENKRPDYINDTIWQKIMDAHQKTHYIKFGYVVAFYWLLDLEEFKDYNKSKLMREIILSHQ